MVGLLFRSSFKDPVNCKIEGEDADEKILYIFRRAFITNLDWIFITLVLTLTPVVANIILLAAGGSARELISPFFAFSLNIFWYLFVFGFAFQNFLNWFFNLYVITDKRIMDLDFVGLLHKNISETSLHNIEDVTSTVSGALKITFNYGNVFIQTAGENREFEFHDVANPSKVRDILSDIVVSIKKGEA